MSKHCPDCGAVAGYGHELGHRSDCPTLRLTHAERLRGILGDLTRSTFGAACICFPGAGWNPECPAHKKAAGDAGLPEQRSCDTPSPSPAPATEGRNEVLEKAALICEEEARASYDNGGFNAFNRAAARIRALKQEGLVAGGDGGSAAGAAPLPDGQSLVPASTADWSRDLVKEIAMDIGKDVCAYIEVMYPQAVKATSSSFLLSVRNSIHNEIMAALETTDEAGIRSRLAERKKFRREWKAQWKRIRSMPDLGAKQEGVDEGAEQDKPSSVCTPISQATQKGDGVLEAALRIVENCDKNGHVYESMADEVEDGVTVARAYLALKEALQ